MAKTNTADAEWLLHIQQDVQRNINMQRSNKYKRRNRLQPPSYPSVKALYVAVLKSEGY